MARPDVDEYFLKIAAVAAERSTCLRHYVGAVTVRDKQILSTGYNGAPAGLPDCLALGCLRNELGIPSGTRHETCRAVHAGHNAIIQASLHRGSLEGATLYCTHTPCILCAKMLTNAKIKRYVSYGKYSDESFMPLFEQAGIQFEQHPRPSPTITFFD